MMLGWLVLLVACGPTSDQALGDSWSDGSASCGVPYGDSSATLRTTDDAQTVGFQPFINGRAQPNKTVDVEVLPEGGPEPSVVTLDSDDQGVFELALADLPASDTQQWSMVFRDRSDTVAFELSLGTIDVDGPGILCAGHLDADGQPMPAQALDEPFTVRAWTWNAEGLSVQFEIQDRDARLGGVEWELIDLAQDPVVDDTASAVLEVSSSDQAEVGGMELSQSAWLLDADGELIEDSGVWFGLWIE